MKPVFGFSGWRWGLRGFPSTLGRTAAPWTVAVKAPGAADRGSPRKYVYIIVLDQAAWESARSGSCRIWCCRCVTALCFFLISGCLRSCFDVVGKLFRGRRKNVTRELKVPVYLRSAPIHPAWRASRRGKKDLQQLFVSLVCFCGADWTQLSLLIPFSLFFAY